MLIIVIFVVIFLIAFGITQSFWASVVVTGICFLSFISSYEEKQSTLKDEEDPSDNG